MLHALLKCASRTMWQAHRCPIVTPARAVVVDLVGVRALSCIAALRDCADNCSIATSASMAGLQTLPTPSQRHGCGASNPRSLPPVAAGAHRRQYARTALQAQSPDGLQRALFAGRQLAPANSFAHRQRYGSGAGDDGSGFRWQPPGQLSAAQNFSIWNGAHDRRKEEAFQT